MKIKIPANPNSGYSVGYGKPPKHGQFKPGQSGNPKGRPKKQLSANEIFLKEAAKLVKVKVGDGTVSIIKKQVLMRKLIDLALQGNMSAMRLVLSQFAVAESAEPIDEPIEPPLTEAEIAVIKMVMENGL